MDRASYIVPPEPRVTERRVLRRPWMRRAVHAALAGGALALPTLFVSTPAAAVLLGFGALCALGAVVLRFVEPRRSVVVQKLDWPWHTTRGSWIHFSAGR